MIHVVLSDFTSEQLAKLRQGREDAQNAALAPFREAEAARKAGVEALHRKYREAWAARRYLLAMVLWFRIIFAPGPNAPPRPVASTVSDAEQILQSGDAGQRSVIDRLAAQLDDRWIALSGYTNQRGEIDAVLVGPEGVACIEVKALNAQLTIDGDDWVRRRIGRRGDVLDGPSAVLDMGGRSPSRQLNEPAEHLRQWLQRHEFGMPIHRWVVLAHSNSTLGGARNLTVDAVVRTDQLDVGTLLAKREIVPLAPHELARVRDLVERDHRHHAARRSRASSADGADKGAPKSVQPTNEQPEPAAPPHGGYAGLPKNPPRGEEAESLQQRRVAQLAALARRVATGTARGDHRDKLLAAIAHDIIEREEPLDTPDLLDHVKREAAAEVVRQMIDEAMQAFEFPDRCVVGLVVPVSVRYRSFGEDLLVRKLANEVNLRMLEHVLPVNLRARRVVFDRRLYSASGLAVLSAKQWRNYLDGLGRLGTDAEAAATPMTVDGRNHRRWMVVCIVGVAVCEPGAVSDARQWARIHLPRVFEDQFEMSMIELDLKRVASASTEESACWGLWTVPAGLRAAAAASHRIAMGLQGQSSSTYSTPGRLKRQAPEASRD